MIDLFHPVTKAVNFKKDNNLLSWSRDIGTWRRDLEDITEIINFHSNCTNLIPIWDSFEEVANNDDVVHYIVDKYSVYISIDRCRTFNRLLIPNGYFITDSHLIDKYIYIAISNNNFTDKKILAIRNDFSGFTELHPGPGNFSSYDFRNIVGNERPKFTEKGTLWALNTFNYNNKIYINGYGYLYYDISCLYQRENTPSGDIGFLVFCLPADDIPDDEPTDRWIFYFCKGPLLIDSESTLDIKSSILYDFPYDLKFVNLQKVHQKFSYISDNEMYVSISDDSRAFSLLFKSIDFGESWELIDLFPFTIEYITKYNGILYSGGDGYTVDPTFFNNPQERKVLYIYSTDGGYTWQEKAQDYYNNKYGGCFSHKGRVEIFVDPDSDDGYGLVGAHNNGAIIYNKPTWAWVAGNTEKVPDNPDDGSWSWVDTVLEVETSLTSANFRLWGTRKHEEKGYHVFSEASDFISESEIIRAIIEEISSSLLIVTTIPKKVQKPLPVRIKVELITNSPIPMGSLLGYLSPQDNLDNYVFDNIYFNEKEKNIEILCLRSIDNNDGTYTNIGKFTLFPHQRLRSGFFEVPLKFISVYGGEAYKSFTLNVDLRIANVRKVKGNSVYLNTQGLVPGKEYKMKLTNLKDKNGNLIGDKFIKFRVPDIKGWDFS